MWTLNKIDASGIYLPFPGYSTISMLEHSDTLGQQIEDFIRSSSLGSYLAPLPHQSWHMTIFNIFSLYPSKKDAGQVHDLLLKLPEAQFIQKHQKASQILTQLPPTLGITSFSKMVTPARIGNVLLLELELNPDFYQKLSQIREELKIVYQKPNDGLKQFHITFAYAFKQLPTEWDEELRKDFDIFGNLIKPLANCSLVRHDIYEYKDMTNFMPWTPNVPKQVVEQ